MEDRTWARDLVYATLRHTLGLERYPLVDDEPLELLPGADSVRVMRALADLEDSLGIRFADDAVRSLATVGDVVTLVATAGTTSG
jgi:acyl carrier protein